MRCSLRPRGRPAVSAYLEAFVLIGIAAGGSAVALGAVLPYASAIQGTGVAVEDADIVQGSYLAIERLTVVDAGKAPLSSFTISTSPASPSAGYCYSLYNPATEGRVGGTCPETATNPGSLAIAYPLSSGGEVGVVITITGAAFTVGADCTLTVTTSAGAQQSVGLRVAAA